MKRAVLSAAAILTCVLSTGFIVRKQMTKEISRLYKLMRKNEIIMKLFDYWLELKQNDISISEKLLCRNFKNAAIYGLGIAGQRLMDELRHENKVNVKYAIDRNAAQRTADVEILTPDSVFPEVDAIIVSAVTDFEAIRDEIRKKSNCAVISLEDLIYE